MPTTPILGITQVSTSQSGKETTINDAVLALEAAGNATLSKDFSAGDVTLSATEATRNYIFLATGATVARNLKFPTTVNSNPLNRIFVVRNTSGYNLTVKFASGTGATVVIPNNESRLINAYNGTDMIVAAEPPSVIAFVSLTDVPGSYAGEGGKFLAVNVAENAIEFIDGVAYPTFAGNAGKYLVVNSTATGVEWAAVPATFTDLTDTPPNYTGMSLKNVRVKSDESGLEFVDPVEAAIVTYVSAQQWRISAVSPGVSSQVGIGEIEFRDLNDIDQTGTGTATASDFDTGFEADKAFDDNLGTGWMIEATYSGDIWIEYDFGVAKEIRSVKLTPITGGVDNMPTEFLIEYWNGTTWVNQGDRLTDTWVDGVAQTFKVNGNAFDAVADAPSDGTAYVRKSGNWSLLSGELDTDGSLAANSDVVAASQKAVKTYVDGHVTGLLDFKGATDCSANPNYPAASKGDTYVVSVAGKIGGASGSVVNVGDWFIAEADNAGGTEAAVGASWGHVVGFSGGFALLTGAVFTGGVQVPAEVYGVGWNGSNETPTKNDVYDKIEAVVAAAGSYTDENARDAIGAALVAGAGIGIAVDDPADTITISSASAWKNPVRAATTVAGTLASSFANGAAIDGVTLATGDRILIKNQASGAENGIYTVNASGAPTRATDADSSADLVSACVFVSEGTVNAERAFVCSNNATIIVGTTALTFVLGSGLPSLTGNASKVLAIKSDESDVEWIAQPYRLPFGFTSTPTSSEKLLVHAFADAVTFADDFAGSVATVGTNPTASFVLTVKVNSVAVGTITISTGGVATFVTTAGALNCAVGDRITVTGPATADATIADVGITLKGTH